MAKSDDLEIVIGADLSGLASDLAKTRSMFQGLARDIERSAPSSKDFTPRIDTSTFIRAGSAIKGAGLSIKSMAADIVGFGAKAAIASGALVGFEAGLSGVSGALDQLKSSVVMAAEFEQNQIAFETMLGSAEKATQVMGDLRKFAAETPFSSKEVTESARQLLAYGFAADDLIPSLKTIGTLAAASAKPLGELVYNVGTTKVQGRATQLDINQLTNKGIDVYPGLAKGLKVDEAAVRKFVEDGRADWDTYKAVLEDLARTRFAGLLEKQSDSLKGSWEQLTDAFDKAKLKLGQVIAQEVGLRGAGKDLEGFAARIEKAFGSNSFREGVRFVGDLVKGGAQLAHEFGRAAIEIASINFDGIEHISPQFGRLVADVKTFVASAQNFKFDKRALAGAGLTIFESIAEPVASLIDYVNVEGRAFADGVNRNFVQPFKDVGRAAKEARDWLRDSWAAKAQQAASDADDWIGQKGLGKEAWARQRAINEQADRDRAYLRDRDIDRPANFNSSFPIEQITKGRDNKYEGALRAMSDVVKFGDPKDQLNHHFYPPKDWEPKEQVWRRYDMLRDRIKDAEKLIKEDNLTQLEPYLKNLRAAEADFVAPYATPRFGSDYAQDRMSDFRRKGQLPPRRDDYVEPTPAAAPAPEKSMKESLRDRMDSFRDRVNDGLAKSELRDSFAKMAEGIRKNESTARTLAGPFAMGALGPWGEIASQVPVPKKDGLYLPTNNKPPAHLVDLATKLNEQYAGAGLNAKLADLKSIFDKNLISGDVYTKARDAAVREVADKLGMNQPSRLPDTVLAGSQEDARLLAQAMGGGQQKTTEDLLREIARLTERSARGIEELGRVRPQVLGFGWAGL